VAKIFQSSKTLVENSARYRGAGCCNLENAGRVPGETEREVDMGLKTWAAGLCAAVAVAGMAFTAPPAGAAPKKKTVANQSQVVIASRNRSRIRVAPRSFLDGGTEVIPGDRKFTDYAIPPGNLSEPLSNTRGTAFNRDTPLSDPFFLPSRRNPYPWSWCVGC
jgi:hypothetical protein